MDERTETPPESSKPRDRWWVPWVPRQPRPAFDTPFDALPPASPALLEALEAETMRSNERYLHEFIEEYGFCPYSRKGRAAGMTARFFYYADTRSIEPLLERMAHVAEHPEWAVVQVICPLIEVGAEAWIDFCFELTEVGNSRLGPLDTYAVAALHPELPYSDENPSALVPLFRRAPDPTIQWVSLEGLRGIYAERNSEKQFVAIDDARAYVEQAPTPRPPLYENIAESNAHMARLLGLDKTAAIVAEIARDAQSRYAKLLLDPTLAAEDS